MRLSYVIILSIASLILVGVIFYFYRLLPPTATSTILPSESLISISKDQPTSTQTDILIQDATSTSMIGNMSPFTPPFDRMDERVTKKPFGIYITPQTSPVQPERFSGYHTGTDFEIFQDEANLPVEIKSICHGPIILKRFVNGYGGVLVQSCLLDNQPVTILYGHLDLNSISAVLNQDIDQGQVLGQLGAGYTSETDGERKHLHLSMHKGTMIELRGYVARQDALESWINPMTLLGI